MSEPTCRICFEPADKDNKLINPCLCTGTSKFVHEKCLQQWRDSADINTPDRRIECMECKYNYVIIEESNHSLCIICVGSILTQKRLYITPILSFIICYAIGDSLCTESFTRSWMIPDNFYNCYNIAPFSITGLYILLILFYEILLYSHIKDNPYALLAEIPIVTILSVIIIFTLGPLGITLVSAIMNILIQARYIEPMISYLRPNERILNYEPESPRNNIIHQLEYKPPSPSPPRTTRRTSRSQSSLSISSDNSYAENQSPTSPTSSTSSLTPLQSANSPTNSPANIPQSPPTPTIPRPYIDISQSQSSSQPRPRLIVPPEIKIISTNENVLHT